MLYRHTTYVFSYCLCLVSMLLKLGPKHYIQSCPKNCLFNILTPWSDVALANFGTAGTGPILNACVQNWLSKRGLGPWSITTDDQQGSIEQPHGSTRTYALKNLALYLTRFIYRFLETGYKKKLGVRCPRRPLFRSQRALHLKALLRSQGALCPKVYS